MKKQVLNAGFFLLLISLAMVSCRKDEDIQKKDIIINPPVTLVESSLFGQVLDENGNPLEGALVITGTTNTETDENGVFQFTDVMMNSYGQLVTASYEGYFLGAKMVEARLATKHYTQFNLIKKNSIGVLSAATGGTVSSGDGVLIDFPANVIKDANDNVYAGNMVVYTSFIDPASDNILETMPGDLRAVNEDSEFVQLETYGMIAVELEDGSGNPLQIMDDKEATIEIPLSANLAAIAPSTIPLWHFDEGSGYWVQEGEAVLTGDKYVGKVGHFSFWNCDYPYDLVQLSGSVVDGNGNGVAYMTVEAELTNGNGVGYAYTDENGDFGGKVPANEEMVIKVYEYSCGNNTTLYEATVGPFSTDTDLGDLVIDPSETSALHITASILDCAMNVVVNGYLKVEANGTKIITADENGMIDATIIVCDATSMDVTAYDTDALKKSSTQTYNIDGLTEIDLGAITACDEDITEFIVYTVDDGNSQTTYTIADPDCGIDSPTFVLMGSGIDSTTTQIVLIGETPGVYNPQWASFGDPANPNGANIFCQGCQDFEVELTSVGQVGEAVTGTFSGQMNSVLGTVTVTGNFAAVRDY